MRPDFLQLQSHLVEQLRPLPFATLLAGIDAHHGDVSLASNDAGPLIWQDELVEDYFAVARFHGFTYLPKDDFASVAGPVVEDVAQVVCSGA